jgi:hypothetical protein
MALLKNSQPDATPSPPRASSVHPNFIFTQQNIVQLFMLLCRLASPCVLHSHPTKISWHCNEYLEGKGTTCRLTLLDRFSSDAVMPTSLSFGKNWAGANGDLIASVVYGGKWELVNVYIHYKMSLPSVSSLEATTDSFTFMHYGRPICLRKIAICQAPTVTEEYTDFYLVVVFDYAIAILEGKDYAWTVLQNQFQFYFR